MSTLAKVENDIRRKLWLAVYVLVLKRDRSNIVSLYHL